VKLKSLLSERFKTMHYYLYNKQYQSLQKYDQQDKLISSMSMPQSDLSKVAKLNTEENILPSVERKLKYEV
jgi:hypothetical protein